MSCMHANQRQWEEYINFLGSGGERLEGEM